jgi:hypothetical protein
MILGRKTLFSAITILSIIGYGFVVFAVAPIGGYVPGETLDPVGCSPGDTDCAVQMAVVIGSSVVSGMQNQVLYTDVDGKVFGDSLFTRDSVSLATTIGVGSGTVLTGFATNSGGANIRYGDTSIGLDTTVATTDSHARMRYRDTVNNILGKIQFNATGNEFSWDGDTTDTIIDALIQGNNLNGVGYKGSALSHNDTTTLEAAAFFAGDTTSTGGTQYEASMSYVKPGFSGVFSYQAFNQGLRASYRDDVANIYSQNLQESTGNSILWNADTTDSISTTFEQSQDILGLGAFSGSALTWQDTNTQINGVVGAIDGSGVGLFPGSILMSTNNIATGASSSITTNYDNVLNIATAIANVGNGGFDSGFEFDDNRMVVRYRNNTSGLESSFESDATSAVTRYTLDGTNEYQTQLGDGTFAFLNTTTNDNYLSLNGVTGAYGIGDLNGAGSSTRLSIDDVAKTITGTSVISGTKNTSMQVGTIPGFSIPGSALDYSNSSNGQSSSVGVGDFTGIGGNPNSGYMTWYDGATFAQALLTTNSNGITGLFTDGSGATYSNEFKLGSAGFTLSSNAGSYTFPLGDSSSNYLMATDGSGQLFWQDPTMVPSDRSLKSNISELSYGLDTLMQLNPVSYTMNQTGKEQIGFIAQEVESLVPELVGEVANGKKGLAYGQMTAVIVKSVQELDLKMTTIETFANSENKTFLNNLIAWLGSAANGLGKLFASEVETKKLCVADDTGSTTCITKSQLDNLLSNQGSGSGTNVPTIPDSDTQGDTLVPNPDPGPAPDLADDPTTVALDPIPDPVVPVVDDSQLIVDPVLP